MPTYIRSVLVRGIGVLAGMSLWIGLIVLALANFDSPVGVPGSIEATWPFWVFALLVTGVFFLWLRRARPGPGWGMFVIGLIIPFFALLANANLAERGGVAFWVVLMALTLIPLPSRRVPAGAT